MARKLIGVGEEETLIPENKSDLQSLNRRANNVEFSLEFTLDMQCSVGTYPASKDVVQMC